MKRLVFGIFALQISALATMAAQNAIPNDGTWGGYDPVTGDFIYSVDTLDEIEALYNATEFYSMRDGSGDLTISSATETTDVYLRHSIANAAINATGFTDLNIIATNLSASTSDYRALDLQTGTNLKIDGGEYFTRRSDYEVAYISVSGSTKLYDTTYVGNGQGNRSKDPVLSVAANSLTIANATENEVIFGSFGTVWSRAVGAIPTGSTDADGTSGYGGIGLNFAGSGSSSLYATNMNVVGGTARTIYWSKSRAGNTVGTTDGTGGTGAVVAANKIRIQDGVALGGVGYNQGLVSIDQIGNMTSIGGNGMTISTANDVAINNLISYGGDSGFAETTDSEMVNVTLTGGDGIAIGTTTTNAVVTGSYYGGNTSYVNADSDVGSITITPGDGIVSTGSGINLDGELSGGDAGTIYVASNTTAIVVNGGDGGNGVFRISNGRYQGGKGAEISIKGSSTSITSKGGDGLTTTGSSYISGGLFKGAKGGSVNASSTIDTTGGNGIVATSGELTITDGSFAGGQGGTSISTSTDATTANGGSGAYANNASLIVNGGTFTGGAKGSAVGGTQTAQSGYGISALDANVTIDGEDAIINDGLQFNATTGNHALNLSQGTINGDIDITMSDGAITTLSITNNGFEAGTFNQSGGEVQVKLTDANQSEFFDGVTIHNGSMNFIESYQASLRGNFSLTGTNSALEFAQGALLQNGTIQAGLSTITSTAGDLVIGNNASVSLSYLTTFDTNGVSSMQGGLINMTSGTLMLTNATSKLTASGYTAKRQGEVTLSTGLVDTGDFTLNDQVNVDLGWLIQTTITNDLGVKATFTYKPLSESIDDIYPAVLASVDAIIADTNKTSESEFYALNSGGQEIARYEISQMPDVSEASLQINSELNNQFAARGTEYRALNNFASSEPMRTQPQGVAGPLNDEKTTQIWIRGFGSKGERERDGSFAGYNSSSWGTVIGIDKSFGNVLIGVGGGFAKSDIDGAYSADIDTYFGSAYSTIGTEQLFADLAVTYAKSSNTETTQNDSNKFDSNLMSLYVGAGKKFNAGRQLTIIPEASFLATLYEQDGYTRNGSWGTGTMKDYDTESYLGSVGATISRSQAFDWLNRRLAFYPEARVHWLHEFNADPDNFQYNVNGVGYLPFAARTREEDILRAGIGFDLWLWKYSSSKLEFDYDALISSAYQEHIFSAQATFKF